MPCILSTSRYRIFPKVTVDATGEWDAYWTWFLSCLGIYRKYRDVIAWNGDWPVKWITWDGKKWLKWNPETKKAEPILGEVQ